jgi:hypothetical protein
LTLRPKTALPVACLRTRLLVWKVQWRAPRRRPTRRPGRASRPRALRQGREALSRGAGTGTMLGCAVFRSPASRQAPPWGHPGRHAKPDSEAQVAGARQYLRGPGEGPGLTAALGQPTEVKAARACAPKLYLLAPLSFFAYCRTPESRSLQFLWTAGTQPLFRPAFRLFSAS